MIGKKSNFSLITRIIPQFGRLEQESKLTETPDIVFLLYIHATTDTRVPIERTSIGEYSKV